MDCKNAKKKLPNPKKDFLLAEKKERKEKRKDKTFRNPSKPSCLF